MDKSQPRVLIVDDEQIICNVLHEELSQRGYFCSEAPDGYNALAKLEKDDFQVVLLDIRLPGISGMELLGKINLCHRGISTIIITAVNDACAAVQAMKLGAKDYIIKPFDLERVGNSVDNVLKTTQVYDTNKTSTEMDAIAFGVEAGQDLFDGHSKRVTQATINIARQLGIHEEEIQKWVLAKTKVEAEKNRVIKTALGKLQKSPIAQDLRHSTNMHHYQASPDEFFT